MASPQCENGYTKIANEIIDELVKTPLLGAEVQVCLFVIRKTYGFGKTEDEISITQFEKATNKSRPTIVKALKNLQLVNILQLVKTGDSRNSSNIYSFNKNYDTWKLVKTPKLVKYNNSTSKVNGNKLVKTPKHTKENTKENTKEIPEWVSKEIFFQYQQSRRKKLKQTSFELFFKKLQKLSTQSNCKPEEILKQSIENGWEGIFELKTGGTNGKYDRSVNQSWKNKADRELPADVAEQADRINQEWLANKALIANGKNNNAPKPDH